MKVTIVNFSQTGNTKKVAEAIATTLQKDAHSVATVPLKSASYKDALDCDVFGIGAPCFACHVPTPVKDYLKSLPDMEGKRSFVFATAGGFSGKVLWDMTRILRKKKSIVLGGLMIRGEDHFPSPYLDGNFLGRPNEKDLKRVKKFAASLSAHMAANRTDPVPEGDDKALSFKLGFYSLLGLTINDTFFRLVTPKPRIAEAQCNQCGWCAKVCPVDNIATNPFPVVGRKCIRCYRCLNGCPQKAFSGNFAFTNLIIMSFYNHTLMRWFGDVEKNEKIR
jgi:flavodoxin/Pyruvate/2-oxoacid:ferredoxin oxidoreductase delta subunit